MNFIYYSCFLADVTTVIVVFTVIYYISKSLFDSLPPYSLNSNFYCSSCPPNVATLTISLQDSKLLTSISATERVRLWDKFGGPVDQDAVKLEFFRKVHRKNPPFRVKVRLNRRNRADVPQMVRDHYRKPVRLLPSLRDVLRAFTGVEIVNDEIKTEMIDDEADDLDKNAFLGELTQDVQSGCNNNALEVDKSNGLKMNGEKEGSCNNGSLNSPKNDFEIKSFFGESAGKEEFQTNGVFKTENDVFNGANSEGIKKECLPDIVSDITVEGEFLTNFCFFPHVLIYFLHVCRL